MNVKHLVYSVGKAGLFALQFSLSVITVFTCFWHFYLVRQKESTINTELGLTEFSLICRIYLNVSYLMVIPGMFAHRLFNGSIKS